MFLKINRKLYDISKMSAEEYSRLTGRPVSDYYKLTGKKPPKVKNLPGSETEKPARKRKSVKKEGDK